MLMFVESIWWCKVDKVWSKKVNIWCKPSWIVTTTLLHFVSAHSVHTALFKVYKHTGASPVGVYVNFAIISVAAKWLAGKIAIYSAKRLSSEEDCCRKDQIKETWLIIFRIYVVAFDLSVLRLFATKPNSVLFVYVWVWHVSELCWLSPSLHLL